MARGPPGLCLPCLPYCYAPGDLDLDLGSGHTAYRHASLVDRYLHAKFRLNRRNFLWTDGRTGGRTFETYSIRSTRMSRSKNDQADQLFSLPRGGRPRDMIAIRPGKKFLFPYLTNQTLYAVDACLLTCTTDLNYLIRYALFGHSTICLPDLRLKNHDKAR